MLRRVQDVAVYALVRGLFALLALLPHGARVSFFAALYRFALILVPRLAKTVWENIRRAFPLASDEWIRTVIRKNATEVGRLLADTVRLAQLDEQWVRGHVRCPILEQYAARLAEQPDRGVLIATGHLGSFELLGHAIGLMGYPLAAVARKFRSPLLDRWWTDMREARGNKIIDRSGAFKEMVATLSRGMSVAVLFDQNVTRNHAVFVDWFGESAATTKSVALAALRTEVPVFVASIKYVGEDRYVIDALECDCSDLYRNEDLSSDEKVRILTQRISDHYCRMIAEFPEGWFWMHRRWKTRPQA